jgi:hypothetical protein
MFIRYQPARESQCPRPAAQSRKGASERPEAIIICFSKTVFLKNMSKMAQPVVVKYRAMPIPTQFSDMG